MRLKSLLSTLCIFAFICLFVAPAIGGDGFNIAVKIDGYEQSELYLGYFYGDKQYLRDTSTVNDEGFFVFSGEEELEGGVYLLVLAPDNRYIQILLNPGEQHFKITTTYEKSTENMAVEGSPSNALFYEYVKFLGERTPQAGELREAIEAAENDKEKEKLQKKTGSTQ